MQFHDRSVGFIRKFGKLLGQGSQLIKNKHLKTKQNKNLRLLLFAKVHP
jgi:hypothetical protein